MKPIKTLPYSRVATLMNMSPDTLVRVWTLQSDQAWLKAQETGYLTGCAEYIESDQHDWPDAYRWMRAQMALRISDFSGDFPVWAWLKRPSAKKWPQKYRGTGEKHRITALVPRSRIVVSNFESWHSVLNRSFLSDTEPDDDAFDKLWPYHPSMQNDEYAEGYRQAVEPSWQKIFTFLSPKEQSPAVLHWHGSAKRYIVQACIDRIHLHEITNYRDMTA